MIGMNETATMSFTFSYKQAGINTLCSRSCSVDIGFFVGKKHATKRYYKKTV